MRIPVGILHCVQNDISVRLSSGFQAEIVIPSLGEESPGEGSLRPSQIGVLPCENAVRDSALRKFRVLRCAAQRTERLRMTSGRGSRLAASFRACEESLKPSRIERLPFGAY